MSSLNIVRANNGFILSHMDEGVGLIQYIIEDKEFYDEPNIRHLVYTILDHFGIVGSKHADIRTRIVDVLQRSKDGNEEYTIEKDGHTYVRITEDSHV